MRGGWSGSGWTGTRLKKIHYGERQRPTLHKKNALDGTQKVWYNPTINLERMISMLKQWGSPSAPYQIVVMFPWRTYFDTVHIGCQSRSEVARVYWQLRRAARDARRAPRHSVPSFPEFGFRWLRCRWLEVSYSYFSIERHVYFDSRSRMLPPARLRAPRTLRPKSIFDLIF